MNPTFEKIPLFANLNATELETLLLFARPAAFAVGEKLFSQGDAADGMYVLESGQVKVCARLLGDALVELSVVGSGEIVGEFSLVDRGVRSATAFATEPTSGYFFGNRYFELLRTDTRPVALKVMHHISQLLCSRLRKANHTILAPESLIKRAHDLQGAQASLADSLHRETLQSIPFFRRFTSNQLNELLSVTRRWDLPRGHVLFTEGSEGRSCFIVVRGAVQVQLDREHKTEQLAILGPGQIFGQVALIDGGLRSATCIVKEGAILLELEQDDFQRLYGSGSSMAFKFSEAVNHSLVKSLRAIDRHMGRLIAEAKARSNSV